jgi:hypothetical protein
MAAIVFLAFCHALSGLHRLLRLLQIPGRQLCPPLVAAALVSLQLHDLARPWPAPPIRIHPPRQGRLN